MAEKYFGKKYEYVGVELVGVRITILDGDEQKEYEPGPDERLYGGPFNRVVHLLNQLGEEGWKIGSAVNSNHGTLWVLMREYEGERKRFSLPEFTPRDG